MHHPTRNLKPDPFAATVLLALLTLLTSAVAQPAPYVDEATGFQVVAPAGWLHEAGSDDDGDRFVTFTHPSGDAAVLVNVSALATSEREVLASGGLLALSALVGERMSEKWPGTSVTDSQVVEVAGDDAGLLSFQGEGLVGAILLSVNADGTAVTTLTVISALAIVDEVAVDLNTALTTFVPPTGDDAAGGRPAVGPTMHVGGLTLSVPSGWSVDQRPGLERSILLGRRETVEEGGARVERTVFPDVRSVAAYARGGAMVIAHAYVWEDLATSLEARSEALREAFERQLLELDWLDTDTIRVAGAAALVTEYLATDRHDGVRYRGRAFVFDGPEGPLLLVLEVPAANAEHYEATLDAMVAGATLEPAPLPIGPGAVPPDPFLGRFGDGYLTLSIEKDGAVYTGVIAVDGERYPLRASGSWAGLVGTFTSAGHDFAFSATFDRATLVFETGGARYRLQHLDDAP